MSNPKTVEIPAGWQPPVEPGEPLVAFISVHNNDERDPTKPIGHDEQGRPLYAPPGITFRL